MAKWTDESVRAALQGRFVMRKYPFPGSAGSERGLEVGVKLLTDAELDSVRLQAATFAKKQHADLIIDPEFLDRAIHREVISRAFVDPAAPDEPFFGSQNDVAELDNLTVRALFELYMLHQQALDPYAFCPPEEVEKLTEALGKSERSVETLSLYDAPTLRLFVIILASMLRATRASPK
jgi:hypothetical protein